MKVKIESSKLFPNKRTVYIDDKTFYYEKDHNIGEGWCSEIALWQACLWYKINPLHAFKAWTPNINWFKNDKRQIVEYLRSRWHNQVRNYRLDAQYVEFVDKYHNCIAYNLEKCIYTGVYRLKNE